VDQLCGVPRARARKQTCILLTPTRKVDKNTYRFFFEAGSPTSILRLDMVLDCYNLTSSDLIYSHV